LPEWQLEPDDEYGYGNPDDYYFVDEDGNLIEPGGVRVHRGGEGASETVPAPPAAKREPPQAASDDFLREAIGNSQRQPQQPAPQPRGDPALRPGQPPPPEGQPRIEY
jgi:penicillin-binding protein 1A